MPEAEAKLTQQIEDFKSAIGHLKEALEEPLDVHNFIRDSAIKRFELCSELAWKTLKQYLFVRHAVECASPLGCLRSAYKVEFIADDPFWVHIFELRNLATHTYKESLAQELFAKLPATLERFDTLLKNMSSALP